MTKIIYFDTFSGISGDMTLGALVHAGLPLEYLQNELSKLNIGNFHLEQHAVEQNNIGGVKVAVVVEQPTAEQHRSFQAIKQLIEGSPLEPVVKSRSLKIFQLLAQAEGRIHGVAAEQVHFHEVGALDSIVDTVGACIGFAYFGIEEFYCGPLPLGRGFVQTQHGLLPVPAPATLELLTLANAPVAPNVTLKGNIEYPGSGELVTPTGAAIIAALCQFQRPKFRLEKNGYGYGSKQLAWPNALRIWIGDTRDKSTEKIEQEDGLEAGEIALLETNLDDMLPEGLGYVMDLLFKAGALDVFFTPIQMKKNRPAVMLSLLASPEKISSLAAIVIKETSSFGVRISRHQRLVAAREIRTISTIYGEAQVKLKIVGGTIVEIAPEYESVAALARQTGLTWRQVYDEIRQTTIG